MNSCLYTGTIRHRRFHPMVNHFRYRLFFVFIDLHELDALFDCHPFFSAHQVNLAYFRRRDHMGPPHVPLDEALRAHIQAQTGRCPQGPIRLLTHLRYFGYCFNPVSIYYCYAPDGRAVETIVTEIHNTPWGEEHLYVLTGDANEHPLDDWRRYRFTKQFHISPFMDMDIAYDWRFRVPGRRLAVHMVNFQNRAKLFDASLTLERRPINRANLSRALLLYPLMTCKVTAMIYFQALRLTLKKAPFFEHPRYRRALDRTRPEIVKE